VIYIFEILWIENNLHTLNLVSFQSLAIKVKHFIHFQLEFDKFDKCFQNQNLNAFKKNIVI